MGSKWKPAPVRLPPAEDHGVGRQPGHEALHPVQLRGTVQRAEVGFVAAHRERGGGSGERCCEFGVDGLLHQHTGHGGAVLPGVEEGAQRDFLGCLLNVDVGKNDGRRLAAKFQVDVLERLRSRGHDLGSGPGGAGDGDHFGNLVVHHRGTGAPPAADDVDDAGRVRLLGQFTQDDGGPGRGVGRLEDQGVACGKGRADLPDGHHERVVPRRDLGDHAERLAADGRGEPGDVLGLRGPGHHAAGAGEEAQLVRAAQDLDLAGDSLRLAGARNFGFEEPVHVGLDEVRELSIMAWRSAGVVRL